MVKPYNSGGAFIKATGIKPNDVVTFLDEGGWEQTKFPKKDKEGNEVFDENGNKVMTQQFLINVDYNGQKCRLKVTKGSYGQIAEAYGEDTLNWVGKKASMMPIPCPNGKDKTILLYPIME